MLRWPSTLRARLTLWYTVVLTVPLVAFGVVSYAVFARTLQSRTDRFIHESLTAFAREAGAERARSNSARDALATTVAEMRFRDLRIAVADVSGHTVATSPGDEATAGAPAPAGDWLALAVRGDHGAGEVALTVPGGRGGFRVISRPLVLDATRFVLAGAYPQADVDAVLERIRRMFLVAIPLLMACAATGGWFLARRSLAPVAAMAARARDIGATNLHERIPVGGGEELMGLARVMNELLDRLEASFSQQRRFMADASHELRTPAAIVRTEAEVTLAQPRNEGEYRDALTVIHDASRRLGRIVDDLFLLARADAGHLTVHREALYLEELVHEATRSVLQLAQRRDVSVEVRSMIQAPFRGDSDLLGRLLLNLLDNAIKYAPPGSAVEVAMSEREARYEITVVDLGPGIPPEAAERVFERFFRADVSRSRSARTATGGAGLGLAIARRIAVMHGGVLTVTSRPGRTAFTLSLPAEDEEGAHQLDTRVAAKPA